MAALGTAIDFGFISDGSVPLPSFKVFNVSHTTEVRAVPRPIRQDPWMAARCSVPGLAAPRSCATAEPNVDGEPIQGVCT